MPDQTPSMPPLPEPRLWVAADLIEDPLNQHDNSILAYQRQQDVHPLDLPAAPLYTAEQVQAVADERVRVALADVAAKLRRAGADLPAPPIQGTIPSAIISGLSVALALVEPPTLSLERKDADHG